MRTTRMSKLTVIAAWVALWTFSFAADALHSQGQQLSPRLPSDVDGSPTQDILDDFSWQLFVALNWPTRNGQADPDTTIGQAPEAPRVWDHYADPIEIFQSSSLCPNESPSSETKLLRMSRDRTGKVDGLDVQAGSVWPLVDQHRNFAMVEVVVNDVYRGYISANGLATSEGIGTYTRESSIAFPDGSLSVKAAWRLFPDDTDPETLARYHTKRALICVAKEQSSTGAPFTIEGTVGLVGFHIVYKTRSQPKWVWSTSSTWTTMRSPTSGCRG